MAVVGRRAVVLRTGFTMGLKALRIWVSTGSRPIAVSAASARQEVLSKLRPTYTSSRVSLLQLHPYLLAMSLQAAHRAPQRLEAVHREFLNRLAAVA